MICDRKFRFGMAIKGRGTDLCSETFAEKHFLQQKRLKSDTENGNELQNSQTKIVVYVRKSEKMLFSLITGR